MRSFIALDLHNISQYIREIQDKIPEDEKLTLPRSYHLTLKFLGDVSEEELSVVKEALDAVRFSPLTLETTGIGAFPNKKFIKVVWLGIKENQELLKLQAEIDNRLSEIGLKKEKDYAPHITLARVKFLKDREEFHTRIDRIKTEPKRLDVKEFILYRSTLTPSGPVYDALKVFHAEHL